MKIKPTDISTTGVPTGSAIVNLDGEAKWASFGSSISAINCRSLVVLFLVSQQGSFRVQRLQFFDSAGVELPAPSSHEGSAVDVANLFASDTTFYEGSRAKINWATDVEIASIRITPTDDIYRDRAPMVFDICPINADGSTQPSLTVSDFNNWTTSIPRNYALKGASSVNVTGVEEAPDDGFLYGRKEGGWVQYANETQSQLEEAPLDGGRYVRRNSGWQELDMETAQWRGAVVGLGASHPLATNNSNSTALSWSFVRVQQGGEFWTALQPQRFTIPAGIDKVRLDAGFRLDSNVGTGTATHAGINHHSADGTHLGRVAESRTYSDLWSGAECTLSSPTLLVSEGDYFTLTIQCEDTSSSVSTSRATFFSIESRANLILPSDAPIDGLYYVRRNGSWAVMPAAVNGGSSGGGAGVSSGFDGAFHTTTNGNATAILTRRIPVSKGVPVLGAAMSPAQDITGIFGFALYEGTSIAGTDHRTIGSPLVSTPLANHTATNGSLLEFNLSDPYIPAEDGFLIAAVYMGVSCPMYNTMPQMGTGWLSQTISEWPATPQIFGTQSNVNTQFLIHYGELVYGGGSAPTISPRAPFNLPVGMELIEDFRETQSLEGWSTIEQTNMSYKANDYGFVITGDDQSSALCASILRPLSECGFPEGLVAGDAIVTHLTPLGESNFYHIAGPVFTDGAVAGAGTQILGGVCSHHGSHMGRVNMGPARYINFDSRAQLGSDESVNGITGGPIWIRLVYLGENTYREDVSLDGDFWFSTTTITTPVAMTHAGFMYTRMDTSSGRGRTSFQLIGKMTGVL